LITSPKRGDSKNGKKNKKEGKAKPVDEFAAVRKAPRMLSS